MLSTLGSIVSQGGKDIMLVWDSSLGTIDCNIHGLPLYNSKSPHEQGLLYPNTVNMGDCSMDISSLNIKASQVTMQVKSIYREGGSVYAGAFIRYEDGTYEYVVWQSSTIALITKTIPLNSSKKVISIGSQWRGDDFGEHIVGIGYAKFTA